MSKSQIYSLIKNNPKLHLYVYIYLFIRLPISITTNTKKLTYVNIYYFIMQIKSIHACKCNKCIALYTLTIIQNVAFTNHIPMTLTIHLLLYLYSWQ
jgi:hypothetical protein